MNELCEMKCECPEIVWHPNRTKLKFDGQHSKVYDMNNNYIGLCSFVNCREIEIDTSELRFAFESKVNRHKYGIISFSVFDDYAEIVVDRPVPFPIEFDKTIL